MDRGMWGHVMCECDFAEGTHAFSESMGFKLFPSRQQLWIAGFLDKGFLMEGSPGSEYFDRFNRSRATFFSPVVPTLHSVVTVRALRWDGFPEVKADLLCESAFLNVSAACLHFDDHAAPCWPVGFHAERTVRELHPTAPCLHRVPKVRHGWFLPR